MADFNEEYAALKVKDDCLFERMSWGKSGSFYFALTRTRESQLPYNLVVGFVPMTDSPVGVPAGAYGKSEVLLDPTGNPIKFISTPPTPESSMREFISDSLSEAMGRNARTEIESHGKNVQGAEVILKFLAALGALPETM